MSEDVQSFADLLKRYRTAAALTQEELAERTRLSVRGLSDLERGARTRPYKYTVQQLIQALELTQEEAERFSRAARGQKAAATQRDTPCLPNPPTPVLGREETIAEALALFGRADVRLLTLSGPPGVGKTRLALELAQCLRELFANRAVFVPLASVREPELVIEVIARTIGLEERGNRTLLEGVKAHIGQERLLLVAR